MSEQMKNPQIEAQRAQILDARKKGKLATLGVFAKFSGPGWLQSATTLGGGSLASALYLGVLGGFGFMWLQPVAMILGIVMLAAISYVTLSIKNKPMQSVNSQISPILGYGWALGSLLACLVFAMPQFALGVAAITQNFSASTDAPSIGVEVAITAVLFALAAAMVAMYAVGGRGVKFFEKIIKLSVAAIVICFFGVIISLWWNGKIDWSAVFAGFVPNLSVLSEPSGDFMKYISQLGADGQKFWSDMIVSQQRDVVISAAAMAVGINMTFLFPYSMLKKGWDKDFRGLAIFDLATGLFIPFLIATSCIVVASASQFHAKPADGLAISRIVDGKLVPATVDGKAIVPAPNLVQPYISLLDSRISASMGADKFAALSSAQKDLARNTFPIKEREMAAMLVKRDASNLSETLAPLLGDDVARYVFGLGVLGMAINAVLMNMLICGLSFAEILGRGNSAKWHLCGSMLIALSAIASVFFKGAKMWLVIHAGVIAMVLLPIAYGAFLVIMNSKKVLGSEAPSGGKRVLWNVLMCCSVAASSVASLYVLWNKLGYAGPAIFAAFLLLVFVSNRLLKASNKI